MEYETYDIGALKDHPVQLYDLAKIVGDILEIISPETSPEIWNVLHKVNFSLWSNLPPVITIDFRDPDDPNTWGEFGPPEQEV